MDFFYCVNAADLTPLKIELVDLVSSCLMKEPPYEAVRPDQAVTNHARKANATAQDQQQQQQQQPPAVNDGVATVLHMRELVHLISRQDGEFVLKLALYTRHVLHLRSSPNYLVALCAREPNCIPFLQPYMEKIVLIPSDWLAIANFAYFYDCDAAHDFSHCVGPHALVEEREDDITTGSLSGDLARSAASRDPRAAATTSSRNHPTSHGSHGSSSHDRSSGKKKKKRAKLDPTRSYLPSALRTSLVHCFAKFTPFSLSKYDNTAAEHRAHRRARRRLLAQQEQQQREGSSSSGSNSDDGSSTSNDEENTEDSNSETGKATNAEAGGEPRRRRALKLTYKQLIRRLHITQPAFLVCCLLGKRYPASEPLFRKMGLHLTDLSWRPTLPLNFAAARAQLNRTSNKEEGKLAETDGDDGTAAVGTADNNVQPYCVFNPSLSGTRMRLPVAQTWETLLSKEGNTGKVWDYLIATRSVGYMALLRNVRNILTRTCSAATHKLVLERLVDEQQVALSQQLPYRFYSAYLAVKEVREMAGLLHKLRPPPLPKQEGGSERGQKPSAGRRGGRGRGRRGARGGGRGGPNTAEENIRKLHDTFENPAASRVILPRYLDQYIHAIDVAMATAARLNVIPMKGVSVVILCITKALFAPMSPTGAAAETASIQRKIDVAAVLIAMMLRSCEQCVVLLYCYDEYVVFREDDDFVAAQLRGVFDSSGDSDTDGDSGSAESSGDQLLGGSDASTAFDPLASTHSQKPRCQPSFMRLVERLVVESTKLLMSKIDAKGRHAQPHLMTSFAMFADGSGAQFPYTFLDEVIERSMRVESLIVFDEGVHRTYANMNRNAPAFGDLPTYLSRLRRVSSPDLVYVGVNLRASDPPQLSPKQQQQQRAAGSRLRDDGAALALQKAAVKARFHHHNDLLLTGFSDAILRLVAERMGGGPLAVVERAAETFHVARFSARAGQEALADRAKALRIVSALLEKGEKGAFDNTGVSGASSQRETAVGLGSAVAAAPSPDTQQMKEADMPNSLPWTVTHPLTHCSVTGTATAVTLPSFDAQGKVVMSTAWETDWDDRARRSERQLRQLMSSSAGLSSGPSSIASSQHASSVGVDFAASGPALLPSIRRLFSKRSTVDEEEPERSSRASDLRATSAGDGGIADADEAAWLAPQGKQVSPIYHPQPFISLVKLLSAGAPTPGFSNPSDASARSKEEGGEGAALTAAKQQRPRVRTSHGPSPSPSASPLPRPQISTVVTAATTAAASATARSHPFPSARSSATPSSRTASSSRHKKAAAAAKLNAAVAGKPFGVVRHLLTSYRVCRFFISSTFLDMNNERNAITLDIFPRLRRWAAESGLKVTLLEVDLRWGIPAVATTRNLSTSVCLNEVSRCSPFFLGMLGARYGSCPPTPLQLVVDEDVEAADYDWMTQLADPHVSVTELEMRHAMYNTRRRLGKHDAMTALFFAREYDQLVASFGPADGAARRVYEGDSPAAAKSLATLKQHITASGFKLVPYTAVYTKSNRSSAAATACANSDSGMEGNDWNSGADGVRGESVVGGAAALSTTRAMLEDELGRHAVRSGRALNAVGPAMHTVADSSSRSASANVDSLWSSVKARINESEEPKVLTSMDVPLDMSDFSAKVFGALQEVIRHVCGVHRGDGDADADDVAEAATAMKEVEQPSRDNPGRAQTHGEEGVAAIETRDAGRAAVVASPASPSIPAAAANTPDLYETLAVAQSEYAWKLSALYAAPRGLLEQLSSFAVAGTLSSMFDSEASTSTPSPASAAAAAATTTTDEGSESPSKRNNNNINQNSHGSRRASQRCVATNSFLLVEGGDGDGKSSTLAALAERILRPMHRAATAIAEARPFLFYSTQAGDDSARSLLFFLATSYRIIFRLYAEMSVQESDSVEQLLLVLDQAYATLHRRYETSSSAVAATSMNRNNNNNNNNNNSNAAVGNSDTSTCPAALVVILDGLDKSSESAELLSLLGTILHPLAAPHIRFIVSAGTRSALANALRTRAPAAWVVPLPLLSEIERAQLVRLHLAAYGKLLEESFSADELKELLRKAGAGRPSCLISCITYLRLFSTFDTLRQDIRSLPATTTQLYVKFFGQLQIRFDSPTCRLVLTLLLLRQPVGGVLEYNLYRLVSNVAVASRLVALLRGICLDSHHGRLFITSAAFIAAVAHTYLPFGSDYQSAQERLLVAELRYQPVDMTMDEQEVRQELRRTREAIERSAVDPLAPCIFSPARYAPRELLGVLQGSVQASRLDVTATLVCYLPFLEYTLISRRMLSQLIGLLSSILHATKRTDDAVAVDGGGGGGSYGSPYGEVDLSPDADLAATANNPFLSGGAPLQWRHYRGEVRRIRHVLEFLQAHYHVLLRQPSLLRQCVWNALASDSCISACDAASMARLRSALQEQQQQPAAPSALRGTTVSGDPAGPSRGHLSPGSSAVTASELSALWVHWLNMRQHGGKTRVQLTTASPQAIRCMAISPDEVEVALGSDDGFVRRVRASQEEAVAPPPQRTGAAGTAYNNNSTSGGGCSRLAPTLRHESAVVAVLYVPQQANGGTNMNFAGRGLGGGFAAAASSSSSSALPTPQLLVSGCVRGIVYLWNLEDNSLLQRGTGHLRSISGLVCHPLEPTVLCTCSHDSYVKLWNLGGAPSRLRDEITSAIALRLPKYPANSPERLKQQRMLNNSNDASGGRGAAAVHQASLASRSTAAQPHFLIPLTAFHTERQHHTPVGCIDFHRSGDIMASGSWDGVLLLYNTKELCTPPPVIPSEPRQPEAPTAAAAAQTRGSGGAVKLRRAKWRERHGPEYRQVAFQSVEFRLGSPVRSISFSASLAVTCVVGCYSGAVVVVDYASRAVAARWTSLHTAPLTCVLTSPDGRCVASADEHGVVRLTHLGISGSLFATLNGHHGAVTGLSFRAQGETEAEVLQGPQQMLLTAGDDRTLQAWQVKSDGGSNNSSGGATAKAPTRCLTASHSTAVTAVAASMDGHKLVTGSADGTAIVFCTAEEEGGMSGWAVDAVADNDDMAGTCSLRSYARLRRGVAWQKSGVFSSAAGAPSAAAVLSEQPPMVPSFVLRHDECRVTCISFALRDTRIVVGVVFGLIYVWSATPGLNRIEGRLLLRVRVPEHGIYPVVALGLREGVRGGAATPLASPRLSHATSESFSEANLISPVSAASGVGGEMNRYRAVTRDPYFAAASDSLDTREDATALVTAVCANGDVAVLKLLGDAASRVMVADQDRRRHQHHQRRRRQRCSDSPRASPNFNASSSSAELVERAAGTSSSTLYNHAGAEETTADAGSLASPNLSAFSQEMPFSAVRQPPSPAKKNTVDGSETQPPPVLDTATTAEKDQQLARLLMRRRRLLDRRAMKLQRLLSRCHSDEVELRDNFQLDLHRHRLEWADSTDAEEITAVVWLSSKTSTTTATGQQQQQQHEASREGVAAAACAASGGESQHQKLALVVTQRKLFLLLSNGHESAVSGGLSIHVPHLTSDAAVLLKNAREMPEEGATAAETNAPDDSSDEGERFGEHARQPDAETPSSMVVTGDVLREMEVDVDYLLSEEEYFTAASAAVAVETTAALDSGSHSGNDEPSSGAATSAHTTTEKGKTTPNAKGVAQPPSSQHVVYAFAVALTTSRGEVLLLRVEVPHLSRHDARARGTPPRTSPVKQQETATNAPTSTTAAQLDEHVLPLTQVRLCQRLSFTRVAPVTGADAAAARDGNEAAPGPATTHRISVAPLATAVQLSVLPDLSSEARVHRQRSAPHDNKSSPFMQANTVEEVALVAGCSDGSARIWLVPTSPLATRDRRTTATSASVADMPIACFFCSSALNVTSPLLLQSSAMPQGPNSFLPKNTQSQQQQLPPRPLLRWVVGDTLGNVYQLQLKRDAPGGVTALLQACAAAKAKRAAAATTGSALSAPGSQLPATDGGVNSNKAFRVNDFASTVGGADTRPWVSSLQSLVGMMDHMPAAEVQETLVMADSSAGLSGGRAANSGIHSGGVGGVASDAAAAGVTTWSMGDASQTPADWLTSVDLSAPVAATLLRRIHSTAAATSAATATSTWEKAAALATATTRATAATQHTHHADSAGMLPPQDWSILPSLPAPLHTTSFTPASSPLFVRSPDTADKTNSEAFDVDQLVLNVLPASPAALPTFGASQYHQKHYESFAAFTQQGSKEGGDATTLVRSFDTPLSDLLSAYRRETQDDEKASIVESEVARLAAPIYTSSAVRASSSMASHSIDTGSCTAPQPQQHQPAATSFLAAHVLTPAPLTDNTNTSTASTVPTGAKANQADLAASRPVSAAPVKPSVRFYLPPPSQVSPLLPGSTQSEVAAVTVPPSTSARKGYANTSVGEETSDGSEDEEDYFAILRQAGPPPTTPRTSDAPSTVAHAKREWFLRQQEVLKEAMRVQRYNKEARVALKVYQQRMASAAGMQ